MRAEKPRRRNDELVPFGDLVGSRVNRWSSLWNQVVGPQLASSSTVAFATRAGVLVVDVDSETTGRELVARQSDIIAAWNLALGGDAPREISSVETRIRAGVGHVEAAGDVAVEPLKPRGDLEQQAEQIRDGIKDPELADALVRARASWLERRAIRREMDER